jgi:hypothetical protein
MFLHHLSLVAMAILLGVQVQRALVDPAQMLEMH